MKRIQLKKKAWQLRRTDASEEPFVFKAFPVVVGSGPSADFVLNDPSVGEVHAQFTQAGDLLMLHDLDSSEGVFVSGHRVKSIPLTPPSKDPYAIHFGDVPCELSFGALPSQNPKPATNPDAIWFYKSTQTGIDHGPLTAPQMFEAVDSGKLSRDDAVWRTDIEYRVKAREVSGLFDPPPSSAGAAEQTAETQEPTVYSLTSSGQGRITCPYCWMHFEPQEALSIATHPELIGDSVLGSEEAKRFLPVRFTPEGLALDARGMRCPDVACPRCHIRLPPMVMSVPPVFLSIVGAPGSGKSYYLASSIWRLRTVLPSVFRHNFADVDAMSNQWVNEYEEQLFFHSGATGAKPIVKTDETAAHVYREVTLDSMRIFLPIPCVFNFSPMAGADSKKCLVLYDNAGEHFQAGHDSIHRPGTQHLLHSEGILFLFDPLADPRFRKFLKGRSNLEIQSSGVHRQDTLLIEMISRIRKHSGLMNGELYEKPLVVGISKADVFGDHFKLNSDPWTLDKELGCHRLDLDQVAEISYRTRRLMSHYAPEVVTTVEGFARKVVFIPVSALGHNPDTAGINPDNIHSQWVEVPLLYILTKAGLLPGPPPHGANADGSGTAPELRANMVHFHAPETGLDHEVPWNYCGYELECERTGVKFKVPWIEDAPII